MKLSARLPFVVLMGWLLAACGTPLSDSPAGTPSTAPTVSDGPVSAMPTPGGAATPGATVDPTPAPIAEDPPPLALELIASGLAAPTNLSSLPGGGLLVTERSGRILALDLDGGTVEVADLSDRVTSGTSGSDERGLLGLALHPDWPDEGRAFVHYTDRDGNTVLAQLAGEAVDGVPRLDPGSERVLLQVSQPFVNHNGGQLLFGPDGMLWLGLGDGGGGGDPFRTGQDPGDLLGSILRLDVAEPGAIRPPHDAPFIDGGGAAEVHLYGLRNPWRFSFDRITGELWVADVGQNAFEEVNRLDPIADAGANLGWNVMEASHCYADADCSTDGLTLPVSEYGRDLGCSISGGYVYRGSAVEGLGGWYLFGDYCAGTIFGIPSDVDALTPPRALLVTDAAISAFGEDAAGELYLADLGGAVYRIVRGG